MWRVGVRTHLLASQRQGVAVVAAAAVAAVANAVPLLLCAAAAAAAAAAALPLLPLLLLPLCFARGICCAFARRCGARRRSC